MTQTPLPSPAAAREYLLGFEHVRGFGLEGFLDTAIDRILTSLALLPALGPDARILEIGAQPYFMTALLLRHWPAQIEVANEDDRGGGDAGRFELKHEGWHGPVALLYTKFNVESDRFPYEDDRFDAVFLCEVIEHLAHDPVHALHEINRVLRPGGTLILSTPNALRIENLWKIMRGRNFYPPYSGWGATSRHNREFTPGELGRLLEANGFAVDALTTHADPGYSYSPALKRLVHFAGRLGVARGYLDGIHVRARKSGPPRYSYPADMFFDAHAYGRVWSSALDMEDAPESQLGRGVYPREVWPPAVRWTGREAMFRLCFKEGHRRAAVRFFSGPAALDRPVEGELSALGATRRFAVAPGTWSTAVLELPPGPRSDTLELVIELDRAWTPAALLGEADTRELGVAVRKVWLE